MFSRYRVWAAALAAVVLGSWAVRSTRAAGPAAAPAPEWSMNATAIEACSCPMFCQCYFNASPAGHHHGGDSGSSHFCRANIAWRINKGTYGATKLDGAKFWAASDLGSDFSKGVMDWNVLIYDKALTAAQREGILAIAGHLFPVKWKSFTTAEGHIDNWSFDKDTAYASVDGGRTAEIRLKRFAGMTDEPIVIRNLRYWGAPRNDGFVLMPNEVEAYRVGPKAFEFKGTNGFMITVDISSRDVPSKAASN